MPLVHRPGEAQVIFGYALDKMAGQLGLQCLSPCDTFP